MQIILYNSIDPTHQGLIIKIENIIQPYSLLHFPLIDKYNDSISKENKPEE